MGPLESRHATCALTRNLPESPAHPTPADLGGQPVTWKAQAFLANPRLQKNSGEHRETRTSGPAYDLPLISEFCAENTPLETENIRLKKRQRDWGVGRRRKREGASRKERGWDSVGRGVLGL